MIASSLMLVKHKSWCPWKNLCTAVRVQPCVSNSMLSLMHLQCISKAPPHTLTYCAPDSTCYTTPHHPLHLHLCMCCLCLFVYLFHWCTCCLFVCLFPLLDCFC